MAKFGNLDRRAAVRELLKDRGKLLMVTGLGSSTYDAFAAGDHAANFYLWGAMGGAAMMGLGLALAQPDRPVCVLTGDGEQLMGLGALASIAARKPANLSIVVLDNGHFGETGMQMSHSGLGIDLHRIAQAAGFAAVSDIRGMEEVSAYRRQLKLARGGPRFATIRIAPGSPPRALPARDGVFLKNRFREHLGFAVK
jgi:thiamine pyrophosphate-dependent acetolactate synthase large subunit-like protein